MTLLKMNECRESFVPVLDDCFVNLKTLANSMTNEHSRRTSLNDFLYKLKCLEKELYLISVRLRETVKRNDGLNKQLESEKEKTRKRIARVYELEAQLASAELKLKVRGTFAGGGAKRLPQAPPPTPRSTTKDTGCQHEFSCDDESVVEDVVDTMRQLRATAHNTLASIWQLVEQPSSSSPSPPAPHCACEEFGEFRRNIDALRHENDLLRHLLSQAGLDVQPSSQNAL